MLSSHPMLIENESQLYQSKTPRRLKARIENAIPTIHNGKGKEVALRTPFHPAAYHTKKDLLVTQTQSKPAISTTRATRPLGDKTPFPNRVGTQQFHTPLPPSSKFLSLLEPQTLLQLDRTPDALLRPSTTRKHVRVPRSASKSFETPVNNGNHWDVSEVSIVMPEAQVEQTTLVEDYDEIEYMPPKTSDPQYQPPLDFELPDYREVGKMLLKFAHSYTYDDSPIAEIDIDESEVLSATWDMLPLSELEDDDPFHQGRTKNTIAATTLPKIAPSKPRAPALTKANSSQAPVLAPRMATTRALSNVSIHKNTIPSRPGTSISVIPTSFPGSKPASKCQPIATKNNTASKAHIPLSRGPATMTTQTGGIPSTGRATTIIATAKPSRAFPSRPATSTATHSRAASTNITTTSMKRPATSTSSYKTTTGRVPQRLAPTKAVASNGMRPPEAVKNTRMQPADGAILLVHDDIKVDDFMFEV